MRPAAADGQHRGAARHRYATTLSAVVVTVLLTACAGVATPSPSPSSGPPSATAAPSASAAPEAECAFLAAEIGAISADITILVDTVASNPLQAIGIVSSISERIGRLQESISDPELTSRITALQTGWNDLVAEAESSVASGDTDGFTKLGTSFDALRAEAVELQEYCTGAS